MGNNTRNAHSHGSSLASAARLGTAAVCLVVSIPLATRAADAGSQAASPAPDGPLAFDAASVKRHPPASGRGRGGRGSQPGIVSDPGRLTMTAVSAGELIEYAFDITSPDRILGRPEWLYQAAYDVVASTSSPATRAQQKLMLQTLLADRFGLVWRREARPGPVYALVPGKAVKLTAVQDSGDPQVPWFTPRLVVHEDRSTETVYSATGASMADLARWLSSQLSRPVLDKTGIGGQFDIRLSVPGPTVNAPGEHATYWTDDRDFISAVQSQLGLRVDPRSGLVEKLVIEHISMPTGN
jgi:uncharacterized protein (TIGR03435 family)